MSKAGDVIFLMSMAAVLLGGWPSLAFYVLKGLYCQNWGISIVGALCVGMLSAMIIGRIAMEDAVAFEYPDSGLVPANQLFLRTIVALPYVILMAGICLQLTMRVIRKFLPKSKNEN